MDDFQKKNVVYRFFSYVVILVFSLLIFESSKVNAQSREGLLSNASIGFAYEDNLLKTKPKQSGRSINIAPNLGYLKSIGKHNVFFSYDGNYASYFDNSDFSYSEHNFNVNGFISLPNSTGVNLSLFYRNEIEEPGSNDSSTSSDLVEFNKFNVIGFQTDLIFGTKRSTGQFLFSGGVNKRDYTNNLQSFRDIESKFLTGLFYYRFTSRFRGLVELTARDITYVSDNIIIDSTNFVTEVLTGFEWNPSLKTSGSFKVGYLERDYDSVELNDISGLSYLIDFNWRPSSYTYFKLSGSKRPIESAQIDVAGYFRNSFDIDIRHDLTDQMNIMIGSSYSDYDISSELSGREDKKYTYRLGATYAFSRNFSSSLELRHVLRDSTVSIFNFNSNVIEMSIFSTFE
ncbi:outer membrane beta-barrel protein [Paraglaciecola marina]|uniref:outer membrane beta-barrel protein n=1 Tax=Paraglaciecola marina TaxID=2500157 RepID=UPI00105C155D|nr:outer membrane beta-barrel protein [Paraglaciecola marina]